MPVSISSLSASIGGLATPGETLTAAIVDSDANDVYSYQWQSSADGTFNDAVSIGSDSPTYQPADGDIGSAIRVVVTATDSDTLAVVSATSAATAAVAPFEWTNSAGGDWSDAGNWNFNAVPGAGDHVVIDAPTATVNLSSPLSHQGLIDLKAGTLADSSGVTLNGGGKLEVSGGSVQGGLTLSGGYAQFTNGATVTDSTGVNPGAITVANGGAIEFDGATDFANDVTLDYGNLFFGEPPLSSNLNTDNGGTGNADGSADPNWTVSGPALPPAQQGVPAAAVDQAIVNNQSWTPDNALSGWIAVPGWTVSGAGSNENAVDQPIASASNPYFYTTTFNVADAANTTIAGFVQIDDYGELILNGGAPLLTENSWQGWVPFVLDAADGLVSGTNTLTIEAAYTDGYDDGVRLQIAQPVVIDSGVTIQGAGYISDNYSSVSGPAIVVNRGTIDANVPGGALTIAPTGFFNEGTIEATNGGLLYVGNNNWTNAADGTVTADSSTLFLDGRLTNLGTISASNSVVLLNGYDTLAGLGNESYSASSGNSYANVTLTNSFLGLTGAIGLNSSDVLDATQGFFDSLRMFNYASIQGGTVVASSSAAGTGALTFNQNGIPYFYNVTLDNAGDWIIPDTVTLNLVGGTLDNSGTLSLGDSNGAANLVVIGGVLVNGGGEINLPSPNGFTSSIVSDGSDSATIENFDNTIAGAGVIGDAYLYIQNDGVWQNGELAPGTIDANVSGQTLAVAPYGLLNNDGLLEATNGGILQIGGNGGTWTNWWDGTIEATDATLELVGPFYNYGTISANNSQIDLQGYVDYNNAQLWTVGGYGNRLAINGTLELDGNTLDTTPGLFYQFTLDGGTLQDGAIFDFGGALNFSGNTQNTLANDIFYDGLIVNGGFVTLSNDIIYGGLTVENGGVVALDNNTQILDWSGSVPGPIVLDNGEIDGGTLDISGGLTLGWSGLGTLHDVYVVNSATQNFDSVNYQDQTLTFDGTLDNSGVINLGSLSNGSIALQVGADGLTLKGGGTISVSPGNNPYGVQSSSQFGALPPIGGNGASATLANVDNTIQGYGQVGDWSLYVQNGAQGVIDANVGGQILQLAPGGGFSNDGLAQATNGGNLSIGDWGGYWTNEWDGRIVANASTVALNGSFGNYGRAEASNGGNLVIGSWWNYWTNGLDGTIVANNSTLTLNGYFSNYGVIDVTDSTVSVNFNSAPIDNSGNFIVTDSTIELAGYFTLEDLGGFSYYAPSTGDVYAPFFATLNGSNTLELTGTLTLDTVDPTIGPASVGVGDTLDATQGLFQNLVVNGGAIYGGTVIVSAAAGGPAGFLGIAQNSLATIHDALIENAGDWKIGAGSAYYGSQTLFADGVLDNSGAVQIGDYGHSNGAGYLFVGSDGLTLKGGGAVTLAGGSYNYYGYTYFYTYYAAIGAYSPATLENVDNTISGVGVVGEYSLSVQNDTGGTINANVSGQVLQVATDGLFSNDGVAEATNGGILAIGGSGTAWTNQADGVISATNSTLVLAGPFVNDGTIDVTGSTLAVVFASAPIGGAGTFDVANSTINLGGAFTLEDLGSFSYAPSTGDRYTQFFANLSGKISLVLNGAVTLDTVDPTITLASVGVGDTLDFTQGFFQNVALANNMTIAGGTVIASAAAGGPTGAINLPANGTLTIHDALVENAGTLTIGGAGNSDSHTLSIDGILDNKGVIQLGSGNTYAYDAIRVGNDGLKIQGGGTITLNNYQYYYYIYNTAQIVGNGYQGLTLENVDNLIQGDGLIGDYGLTVHNDHGGVIDANVNGATLRLAPYGLLDNDGTVEATNGATLQIGGNGGSWTNEADGAITVINSTLTLAGPFTNLGTIVATNSAVNLTGTVTLPELGTIQRTGGSLQLTGTLDLAGETLDTSQGAFQGLYLNGGAIENGTLVGGGVSLPWNSANLYSNVEIKGGLTVSNGFIRLANGATVTDAAGVNPGEIKVVNAQVTLDGYSDLVNNVTLTNSNLYLAGGVRVASPLNTDNGNLPGGSGDPNWTVNGAPAAVLSDGAINGSESTNLYYYWAADNATSGWIGVNDGVYQPAAPYTFTTSFNVANATDEILAGLFYIDESGYVSLNGKQVASGGNYSSGSLFLLDQQNGLVNGANTLSVTVSGADQYYDGVRVQMLQAYTIDAGVTVQGNGVIADNWNGQGQQLIINRGLIDASGGWLYVEPTGFLNKGVVEASNGGVAYIGAPNFANLVSGALIGGAYEALANSSVVIAGYPTITTLAANVVLGGAGANVANLNQTLNAIAAGGRLELDSGATFAALNNLDDFGAIVLAGGSLSDALITVENGANITGAGSIAGAVNDLGRIEAAGGTLAISGVVSGSGNLVIDSGAKLQLGLGGGAAMTFAGAVNDSGVLEVAGGKVNLAGAVSGSGILLIDNGATLELGAGDTAQVAFAGAQGVLKLDNSAAFAAAGAAITGLQIGDTIDLADASVTGYSLVGTDLTVNLAGGGSIDFANVTGPGGALLSGVVVNIQGDGAHGSDLFLALNTTNLAHPAILTPVGTGNSLVLADAHVTTVQTDKITLAIANNPTGNPIDGLNVGIGASTGAAYGAGSIVSLAPGQSSSSAIAVGVDDTSAGAKSGTVQIQFTSDGTVSGAKTPLPSQELALSGNVYRLAKPQISTPATAYVHVGDPGSEALTISNADPADGYSENLIATAVGVTGALISDSGAVALAPGAADSSKLIVNFSTAAVGYESGSALFALTSDGTGIDTLGQTPLGQTSVPVNVVVDNYAAPAFTTFGTTFGAAALAQNGANWTINLGNLAQGTNAPSFYVGAFNAASGPADFLSGQYSIGNASSAFNNSYFGGFSGIGAQQSSGYGYGYGYVTLSTSQIGSFSETITLTSTGSNPSGYSAALTAQTLTITANVIAPPILTVSAISAPSKALAGNAVTLSWIDSNSGDTTAAGSWTDAVYLASDAQGDNLVYLGAVSVAGNLAAGGSQAESATFTLPWTITGAEYFVVRADVNNTESSAAPSKQSVSPTPTAISYPLAPELVVSSIGAPATASAGQQAVVSWTVTNQGDAAAIGPWTDSVYLASDAQGDNQVLVGSFAFNGSLAAGASETRTEIVTLPSSYSGAGWFVVDADNYNQVKENPGSSSKDGFAATPTIIAPVLYPDLVVTSVTPPTTAFSGQQTQVSWVVSNIGASATTTPYWTDKVYLSLNRTLDTSAILLASVANPSYLARGGSYGNSVAVTLPQGLSGPYYIIVAADGGGQQKEGPGASGNNALASSSFQVNASPTPLLEVENVIAPAQAFSGQPLTLSWTVTNAGSASTGVATWTDQVLLSTDGLLDSTAKVVATVTNSSAVVPAGGSYKESATFNLPIGVSGTETFFVVANANQQVYEVGNPQSYAGSATVQVNLTPPPDLVPTLGALPKGAVTGHQLALSYTVTNDGATATPNSYWYDSVYLSAQPTLNTTSQLLATNVHYGVLAAGQSYTVAQNYTLSNSLFGGYYVIVKTDSYNQVFELTHNDSTVVGGPINVNFNAVDLVAGNVSAPATAEAGHQILVSYEIQNQGGGDTGVTSWVDSIVLSASGVLGASDNIVVGSNYNSKALFGGQDYIRNVAVNLPNTLGGAYTLFVVADSGHTVPQSSYADSASAGQSIVIAPLPNLRVTSLTAPTSDTAGDQVTLNWTVSNTGAGATDSGAWTDSVYLTGPTYNYLGSVAHSGVLASGASYSTQGTFTLPAGLPTGTYSYVVTTNRNSSVAESNPNDDSASATTQITAQSSQGTSGASNHPELTTSGVTAPTAGVSGQSVAVSWTLTNSGDPTPTLVHWYDEVYLSTSPTLGGGTTIALGYLDHGAVLASGGTATYTQNFTLPSGISGSYYVIVSADNGDALNEPSRSGNIADSASPIQISLPPAGDSPNSTLLSVGAISVPQTASTGQPVSVSYTVNNLGSGASGESWVDRLYLSTTGVWNVSAPLLGTVNHSGGIAGNSSYTATLATTLPGVAAGNYYVIVRSDVYNAQPETDQSNKTRASSDEIAVGVPTLTLGTPATGSLSAGGAVYYQFTVGAGQVVDLSMTGSASNAANDIYVSYGQTPTIGQFDATSKIPLSQDPTAVLRETQAGTYYVMLRESAGGSENYSITANTVPYSITSVSPNVGSNVGDVTITVDGAHFNANEKVELTDSKGDVVATATHVQWVNSGELWATFDLHGVATGAYNVETEDAANSATLKNAFTVTGGPAGKLAVSLVAPAQLHTHDSPDGLPGTQNGVVTISYSNVGQTDIAAPILDLKASNANFIPGAVGLIGASEISIDGITQSGGPAGILQPGATETVSYTFHGYFKYAQFITMNLSLGVLQGSSAAIDWSSFDSSSQPAAVDSADWNLIRGRFKAQLGSTAQSLIDALSQDATTLSAIGQTTDDLGALLAYELNRAEGTLTQVTLSRATDLSTTGQRLDLTLSRSYSSDFLTRNAAGAFGDGWSFTYGVDAVTDASGDVTIVSPQGDEFFTAAGAGSFTAASGDSSVLTEVSGQYVLTKANGTVETFRLDGQIGTISNSSGYKITVTYDANGVIAGVQDSIGQSLAFTTNAAGRITSATDSQGQTATYSYDSTGSLLLSASGPEGTTTYSYDNSSNPYRHNALTQVAGSDGSQQNFTYDALGDLSGESGANGSNPLTFTYGATGVVTEANASGDAATLIYGTNGQVAEVQNAQGGVTQFSYDALGDITSFVTPNGEKYKFGYDARGNLTSYTDPNGGTAKVTYVGGTSKIASFTDQDGNTTNYSYNSAGDLIGIVYDDGSGSSAAYSASGLLISTTNARGQTTSYAYNVAGELTSQNFSDGTSEHYSYNAVGEMISSTATDGGVTHYTYNAAGALASITDPQGRVESYGYNAAGQEIQRVEPDGSIENFAYNSAGQLISLTDGSGHSIASYSYDSAGRFTGETEGNGASAAYSYNSNGNVTSIVTYDASHAVTSSLNYTYNADGQPVSVASQDGAWTYSYDSAGQLVHAVFASTTASIANQDLTYKYDAAGNRTQTIFNGEVTNYLTNGLNQYTSANGTIYSYNADGDLVSSNAGGQITSYGYNSQNKLTSVAAPDGTVTTYGYDALGNRASETVNGVTSTYVTDPLALYSAATGPLASIAQVYNSSGQVTATYDYGNGLAALSAGGATYYYNGDILGNVTSLSGAGGALVDTYAYTPFGTLLSSTGSVANPFQYAGLSGDATTRDGLVALGVRVYDPATGRFTSPDPTGLAGGANAYSYVSNDVTYAVDPLGKDELFVGGGGGVYLGVGFGLGFGVVITNNNAYGLPDIGTYVAPQAGAGYGAGATLQGGYDSRPYSGFKGQSYNAEVTALAGAGTLIINPATGKPVGGAGGISTPGLGGNVNTSYTYTLSLGENVIIPIINGLGSLFGVTPILPVQSVDPNEIIGPTAYGAQNFVAAGAPLSYTIDFENSKTASAPAQAVTVTQQLDSSLDWRTFRLTGFGFDNLTTSLPGASPFYSGLLDYSATKGYDVQVTAGVNVQTGLVTWTFQTIDPATGVPPTDPQLGLLPVDNSYGDGEGFVSYTVKAKASDPTGTTISAQAQVIFDTNGPIDTPIVTDTVDSVAPTSIVEALPPQSATATFEVSWSGQDDAAGSGIGSYTIFVSEDGGSQTAWLNDTTRANALFHGDLGHVYAFYSQAVDNAGNQEAAHDTADATIEVGTVAPTGLALSPSSQQGSSTNVTADITPTITGAADPGANVTLYDGANVVGTAVADAITGLWSISTTTLPYGLQTLTATAVNGAGVVSPASAPLQITVVSPSHDLTVAQYVADPSAADAAPAGFNITDSAAKVSTIFDTLNADSHLDAITLTDSGTPVLTLTAAQGLGDTTALGKIANASYAIVIQDTAAHVAANLDALQANPHVTAITLTDPSDPLAVSLAHLTSDAGALGELTNGYSLAVTGSAAAVAGALDALQANAHVTAITLTDPSDPLAVSV
ncbi:CARDB domain-containing protein, partial [uncultured Rhodoblastus sp.]|uniref:CARDB domain-containing protein n=1 Tax=uncultured Rhodoblastus sp. TaxID=543037 RepID=UPI0025F5F4FE